MKRFDSMNVIPLIDVMLVLLAIVLLTASFIAHDKLDIQLPKTESTQSQSVQDLTILNLALDKQGQIFWEGEVITETQLSPRMAQVERTTLIQVKVDQSVEFRHFVLLMDVFKQHQHEKLTILTERKAK
jgi:biopolymer transport protein ExbD